MAWAPRGGQAFELDTQPDFYRWDEPKRALNWAQTVLISNEDKSAWSLAQSGLPVVSSLSP